MWVAWQCVWKGSLGASKLERAASPSGHALSTGAGRATLVSLNGAGTMRDVLLVLAVFAACVVESVEALTIVLAVGVTRGWKATMRGVAAGLVTLAVIVAALGPALTVIPINALRLIVGGLLLVFGLGWLR
ncbi:MAG: hypothetical protein QOF39_3123, partial [Frankiales bacterium]|nr:hypothetical protein [Frankiales bacterium]